MTGVQTCALPILRFYERSLSSLSTDDSLYYTTELKIAQVYSLLQNKIKSIEHFNNVFINASKLFSTNDIFLYTDALRRNGQREDAEKVIRSFAFDGTYHRSQRFINTLNSLSSYAYSYEKGLTSYAVRKVNASSPYSNYWIGEYDSLPFFAQSLSGELTSNDKVIYHQTRFRKFEDDNFQQDYVFEKIPKQLQQGPMAYNKDNGLLVVTNVSYNYNDEKNFISNANQNFTSKLLYSQYDEERSRWSSFKPLCLDVVESKYKSHKDSNPVYSDAHPSFFNNGNSLIFSSNRNGGLGGMDIYITHWDKSTQSWGRPINMGSEVNSEGDEIYPRIYGDALFFSSNGLEGLGGFDNYRISFGNNVILSGSLFNYPYPVNSVYNDFGFFFYDTNAFFISDRQESGHDNMYVLFNAPTSLSSEGAIGVSREYAAMRGNSDMIESMSYGYTSDRRTDVNLREFVDKTEYLQIYFDFDSDRLSSSANTKLKTLIDNLNVSDIQEIYIVGYADLIGSKEYNQTLSLDRAEKVAEYFQKNTPEIPLKYLGRGIVELSKQEKQRIEDYMKNISFDKSNNVISENALSVSISKDQMIKKLFKRYRRVDIVIKNKHNYNK